MQTIMVDYKTEDLINRVLFDTKVDKGDASKPPSHADRYSQTSRPSQRKQRVATAAPAHDEYSNKSKS